MGLLFLMGLSRIGEITKGLMDAGMDPKTPAAAVENAANFNTRKIISSLEKLEGEILKKKFKSPSLLIVGETVKLSDELDFLMAKPLFSKNVVLFRDRIRGEKTLKAFNEMGANAFLLPSFKINYLPDDFILSKIGDLKSYDLVIFSSQNAVNGFFTAFFKKFDLRDFSNTKFLAIGPKTEKALNEFYVKVDYVSQKAVGESLVQKLKEISGPRKLKVLYPRSNITREEILLDLDKICDLNSFPVYENEKEVNSEIFESLLKLESPYLVFTSSSSFNNFYESYERAEDLLKKGKIISIGEITTSAIKKRFFNPYRESEKSTIEDIINIIRKD